MFRTHETEVLVVGAGPVGMMTALLLSENGVDVEIIDAESRPAAHSYACALHPRSLELLDRLGVVKEALQAGRRIDSVAFYEGRERRAEVRLASLPADFPFLLVLPQSELERILEERLGRKKGVPVGWNHRLSTLKTESGSPLALVDKLVETCKGYAVPSWEWVVQRTLRTTADYVVGADGHNSMVRKSLGIEYEWLAEPELFEVYEFETDVMLPPEVRVVLDESSTNVMWPLTEHRCRWSFQALRRPEATDEDWSKDRSDVIVEEEADVHPTRDRVMHLLQERAPWFEGQMKDVEWFVVVPFERRLAKQLGRDRVWLLGDAVHQTGPVGMQSMNLGLCEADQLAQVLTRILKENAPSKELDRFGEEYLAASQLLLGKGGELKPTAETSPWVRRYADRLLPCLPATGADLKLLLRELGLEVA